MSIWKPNQGQLPPLDFAQLPESVPPESDPGTDARALISDPETAVKTLNPFDVRAAAWDIARDVAEPRLAVELALTLIPRDEDS